jgi:hypothetical protein
MSDTMTHKMPSELEAYLFDLRGYIVLQGAVDGDDIREMNEAVDALLPMKPGEWRGPLHALGSSADDPPDNLVIENIFEAGAVFERMIDHPSWIDTMRRFVGSTDGLFIDEAFVNVRLSKTGLGLHSGAHKRRIRTQYRYHNGEFRCGQINILLALTDIGPGDGPTMLIPGSHKSNLIHPAFAERPGSLEGVEGAIEVHLKAGDAALFVDCVAHGAGFRSNEGERRILLYRYGPGWGNNRYGYEPSAELIERLTPERRKIIQPKPPLMPPEYARGNHK